MKRYKGNFVCKILFMMIIVFAACKAPVYRIDHHEKMMRVHSDSIGTIDSTVYRMILPYKSIMQAQINIVVGITETTLLREKPEGTLGNLAANAVMEQASRISSSQVDLCVLNAGGLRIASLGAGNITVGKMFELMPFDNEMVMLELKGSDLKLLFKLIGENEGWPIAGAVCKLNGKQVKFIQIGGKPIEDDSTYTLATSDYLANGGDMASCLQHPLKRVDLKVKIRDAISSYVKEHSPLHLEKEGRIIKE